MMLRVFSLLVVFSFFVLPFVAANDLSGYPEFYTKGNRLNVIVVVGETAPATHVIAQAQIVTSLTGYVGRPQSGLAVLDSDIGEYIERNIISVGSACDNKVTAMILENPVPCDRGMEPGTGRIVHIFDQGIEYTIIESYSGAGVRRGAEILADFEDYDLEGNTYEYTVDGEEAVPQQVEEKEKVPEIEDEETTGEERDEPVEDNETEDKEVLDGSLSLEDQGPGPVPILKEEDNFFKKVFSWLRGLFS